jgi:uncharacterized membrane protein
VALLYVAWKGSYTTGIKILLSVVFSLFAFVFALLLITYVIRAYASLTPAGRKSTKLEDYRIAAQLELVLPLLSNNPARDCVKEAIALYNVGQDAGVSDDEIVDSVYNELGLAADINASRSAVEEVVKAIQATTPGSQSNKPIQQ